MVVTDQASIAFMQRVINDFERRVAEKASAKAKAGLTLVEPSCVQRFRFIALATLQHQIAARQKLAQLTPVQWGELMDITLLWTWLRPRLEIMFGSKSDEMRQIREMWTLGSGTRLLQCCCVTACDISN